MPLLNQPAPAQRARQAADRGTGAPARPRPDSADSLVESLRRCGEVARRQADHGEVAAQSCAALIEAATLAARAADQDDEPETCPVCLLRAAWEQARACAILARFAVAAERDRRLGRPRRCDGDCDVGR